VEVWRVGVYVNPGNDGFKTITRRRYVDKTGLIALFDETLDSAEKLVMVSRPRRFGKSFAAKMLVAYYSCGCDSRELFQGLSISACACFGDNLNAYNVVQLDMSAMVQVSGAQNVVAEVARALVPELRSLTPGAEPGGEGLVGELKPALMDAVLATGKKFVFVIDEWDAPYRLAQDDGQAQDAYAEWLRSLFMDATFTDVAIAGAYMTGILPIKKYGHQSAVSDFREFTMIRAGKYAPYVGFSEDEVAMLCAEYSLDVDDVKRWYDGYELYVPKTPTSQARRVCAFAPYSVMQSCAMGETGSYWTSTETYESLRHYIDMDFDGLQGDVVRAIGGDSLRVNPDKFQNDMVSIRSRDDVLTLLVHLGYLTYDSKTHCARIPNEEVRGEFRNSVEESSHPEQARVMSDSIRLVNDVLAMDEGAVAEAIERAHDQSCSPLNYNSEAALRAVVKAALIAAVDDYAVVDELPSGRGYVDVAYLPRFGSAKPALLVELKWNKPVEAALDQVRDRRYPQVLQDLDVPVLLVGVTYDAQTKVHSCRISSL